MFIKPTLGIAGALLVFLGVFTPVESLPLLGDNSFMGAWQLGGGMVLCLAALSIVLVLIDKYRFLWATGGAAWLLSSGFLISFLSRNNYDFSSMRWGWLVLFAGSALLIATAVVEEISLRS